MKLLSATTLIFLSVYFLTLPQWIMQVVGVTLCSLGFILFVAITDKENQQQNLHLITSTESTEDYNRYHDSRLEIESENTQTNTSMQSHETLESRHNHSNKTTSIE